MCRLWWGEAQWCLNTILFHAHCARILLHTNTRITTLCKILACLHRFVLATCSVFYAKQSKIASCFIFVEFSKLLWIFTGISVLASKKDCNLWSCNKKRMESIEFFAKPFFLEGFVFFMISWKIENFLFWESCRFC